MSTGRAEVIPIIRGAANRLDKMERSQLVTFYEQTRTASNEWLRRQIVERGRIDILAGAILGYELQPFHLSMLLFQARHPESLQLSFRGSGKTTLCTVTRAIFYFCINRDFTLILSSESKSNAAGFLREIKGHFENNGRLIEVFGPFYDPHVVAKWDVHEIDVIGKKHFGKESSIQATGIDAAVTSKHFDAGIYDDLAVEENSRTEAGREKTRTWYYKTWMPLIKPQDSSVRFRGEHHGLGTRQHPEDIYGHLIENELKDHWQRIGALDDRGNSPWPARYPPSFFEDRRRKMGIILFNAQYQLDVEAMRGEVFEYDDCQQLSDKDFPVPGGLQIYMGVDLAVGEKDKHCMFAISVIGVKGNVLKDDIYVYLLDYYLEHLKASQQPSKVIDFYDRWRPLRIGIEINQYQDVLRQVVVEERPGARILKIHTDLDKLTRALRLAPLFEGKRVFFQSGGVHARPIDHLVRFPNGKFTLDFFDSFDNAVRAARKRPGKHRSRRTEFGVLG